MSSRDRTLIIVICAIGLVLIASVVWVAATTPLEPTPTPEAALDSVSLIERDLEAGIIDVDAAVRYEIWVLYDAAQLPARYRSSVPIHDGTPVLKDILRRWDTLSAETQELVRQYLEGSEPEGSIDSAMVRANGPSARPALLASPLSDSSVESSSVSVRFQTLITHTEHFAIVYQQSDNNDMLIARDALEQSWERIVGALGYQAPEGRRNTPEGRKILVEIRKLHSGIVGQASPFGFGNQMELADNMEWNPGLIQVTCAHEFFHVVQFTYDTLEDDWWSEATAVWAEDEVFDQVDDYVGYLDEFLDHPDVSLDSDEPGDFEYGLVIYAKFLSEKYDQGVIREVWERCRDSLPIVNTNPALQALDEELVEREGLVLAAPGSGIGNSYPEFVRRNYEKKYEQGTSYPDVAIFANRALQPDQIIQGNGQINHLAANYIEFNGSQLTGLANGSEYTLRLEIATDSDLAYGAASLIRARHDGTFEDTDRVDFSLRISPTTGELGGEAAIEIPQFAATYEKVILATSCTSSEGQFAYSYRVQLIPGAPPGVTPIVSAATSTALVIDISGSMGDYWQGGIKIESAKSAATQMVNMMEAESQIGAVNHRVSVASFSTDAYLDLNLTEDYDGARETISWLEPLNSTNVGAGLTVANEELARADPQSSRFIILLSDGMTNEGMTPDQIIAGPVQDARNAGICIYTVGFGDSGDIDEDLLRKIASESACGEYYYATDAYRLESVYVEIRHRALGELIGNFSGHVAQGETVQPGEVTVEPGHDQLAATLNWPGSRLDLILTDPTGRQVDESYPGASVFIDARPVYFIIENPRPGVWQVAVAGTNVPEGVTSFNVILSTREAAVPMAPDNSGLILVTMGTLLCVVVIWLVLSTRQPSVGVWVVGTDPARFVAIRRGVLSIGRDPACSLSLADPKVSRTHAEIGRSAQGYSIRDLNSTNGTFVNDKKITRQVLRDGDEIRVGDTRLRFRGRG